MTTPNTAAYARGGRRLTPPMLVAQARLETLPKNEIHHRDLLTNLRKGRAILGLTCQQLDILCFFIGWTRPEEWRDDGFPVCTARNIDIQERFDIGRTRVKQVLRALAEAGWIAHCDSPNGHRYRRGRDCADEGGTAYGIDLTPLSRRFPEIVQAAQTAAWRRDEARRLRHEITRASKRVYALAEVGERLNHDSRDISDAVSKMATLSRLRGESRDPDTLEMILSEIATLEASLDAKVSMAAQAQTVESDPMGPPERPHYTTTNSGCTAKATVSGAGSAGVCNEAARSRNDIAPLKTHSVLRGFRAGPEFVLRVAPQLRDFCTSERPKDQEIIEAALFACHELGISRHAWRQGDAVFGSYENAVVIAAIAARTRKGEVKSPGGLHRAMIRRHLEGNLLFDRTLYGLADGCDAKSATRH